MLAGFRLCSQVFWAASLPQCAHKAATSPVAVSYLSACSDGMRTIEDLRTWRGLNKAQSHGLLYYNDSAHRIPRAEVLPAAEPHCCGAALRQYSCACAHAACP